MNMVNKFIHEDQTAQIYKDKDKFKFRIWHYTKVKDNQKLQFTIYPQSYLTQKEAEDRAMELINNNLQSGNWTKNLLLKK